jgi:hypothetical protein
MHQITLFPNDLNFVALAMLNALSTPDAVPRNSIVSIDKVSACQQSLNISGVCCNSLELEHRGH